KQDRRRPRRPTKRRWFGLPAGRSRCPAGGIQGDVNQLAGRTAMKKQSYRPVSRRGYTLMEMLLVQGVIVAFVAMSWPALKGSLEKNRLLAAARQVRTELVQARLKATETGVAQQFRYQTGD